jgi:glycosyltransferase involved in cell wall biosynthesis
MSQKPLISIVTPCYNEEANVEELYRRVTSITSEIKDYQFEFIVIDNHSTDRTVEKLKAIAKQDKSLKIIVNTRNFGHIRSPYYGILQSQGVATIYLASDLQDPPEIIPQFIKEWEEGYKIVMATKPQSEGSKSMHFLRMAYYRIMDLISDAPLTKDTTGFGLYDKEVLDQLRQLNEPYPYLRGLICELGYEIKTIPFLQPIRRRGITKNNFFTLYDIAILGVVSHSKMPIRLCILFGFLLGLLSFIAAFACIVIKIIYWDSFPLGIIPTWVILFFFFGVQFIFIGILGEYISSIHTYIRKIPHVIEKERINFD